MKKVFISYSYQDFEARQSVLVLKDKLLNLGAEPIVFSDSIEAGNYWQMSITEQISRASVFICFMERDNPNVMFELGYALAKNKKIILVGDFKDLPVDLRSMTYLPRESNPYDILMHVESYLSSKTLDIYPYELDLKQPKHTIEMLIARPEFLDNLDPHEFEKRIMKWFSMRGYNVEQTKASRDYGYDLLVSPFRGDRAAVEVKKYKSTSQVPLSVVRQLVGSMALERISCGIIVSTVPFTNSINYFVQDIEPTILLWTLDDLLKMDKIPNTMIEQMPKGEVDEALKLHQKELNVYDKIGDTQAKVSALRDIARIKVSKGEVGEALKLHQEMIQVFDKLGDTQSKADTIGDIASILVSKGEIDEALKLQRERIQVFERLGDIRSKAVTLGDIARILVSKGEVAEALKLQQERIQIFEKLGDTRSKAVTLGDIARILVFKGEVGQALKLHQKALNVYEKLGDTRTKAVTLGDIASILVSKGEVGQALKLHQERIHIFKKLGDLDARANTLWSMSKIFIEKDNVQKAFECLVESYQINLKLGRIDGICYVGVDLGMLLCQANQKKEGLTILEKSREGFEKMGQIELSSQIHDIIKRFNNKKNMTNRFA